jgi:DNA-binding NtrC family response regulator
MLSATAPSIVGYVPATPSYVLVVDDHEPSLRRLEELITLSGYPCVAASSGTEALLCCDRSRPRIIVTDLTMPNLDGRGLALWLQARHPSVPIILMTGQAFDSRSLGEMKRIFTAVLPKPVDIDMLMGLLDRLMPPQCSKRDRDPRRS